LTFLTFSNKNTTNKHKQTQSNKQTNKHKNTTNKHKHTYHNRTHKQTTYPHTQHKHTNTEQLTHVEDSGSGFVINKAPEVGARCLALYVDGKEYEAVIEQIEANSKRIKTNKHE